MKIVAHGAVADTRRGQRDASWREYHHGTRFVNRSATPIPGHA